MMGERILYFSEIAALFRRKYRFISLVVIICFSTILTAILMFRPSLYQAEATFRQASGGADASSVQAILKTIQQVPRETAASGILFSNYLISEAVSIVGLQADWEGIQEVAYSGDQLLTLTIEPLDSIRFQIVGIGEGELGSPFECDSFTLTLGQMPVSVKTVTLTPMRQVISKVHKRLKIVGSRYDSNLLKITYKDPIRVRAIAFVDTLMGQYQHYLHEQHEQIALAQIDFLQKRKGELFRSFQEALDEHVAYLEGEVNSAGYLGLTQEVEMLSEPKETYTAKRHQLDLEIKKWHAPKLEARMEHPWADGVERREALSLEETRLAGDFPPAEEYSGIDLELAESLFNRYAETRDGICSSIRSIERVLDQIDGEAFEIHGLSQVLTDPTSHSIIGKAAELSMKLSDTNSYTSKERRASQNLLDTQKAALKQHIIGQKKNLDERLDQVEEKLAKLRGTALDLIRREKASVEGKLVEIGDQLHKIPSKWRKESQLKMEKELTMQIMEGLSQLSESKVINHHLFHIESGPLDDADASLDPQPRHALLFAGMGGIIGGCFAFLLILIHAVSRGLPVSRPYLMERGYRLVEGGAIADKLALQLDPNEVIAVIDWEGADGLKKALAIRGIKATIQLCPDIPFEWEKPQGCVLLVCHGIHEAVRSVMISDRFIIHAHDKRPDDLEVFPKSSSIFVL